MVGPEDVPGPLISLAFSWAKIRNLPVSLRMVPRLSKGRCTRWGFMQV